MGLKSDIVVVELQCIEKPPWTWKPWRFVQML